MATLEELEDVLVQAGRAGDQEAVTRISDAMKAHPTFQRNAREQLASQEYRYDENFNELSKGEQRAKMSKLTARSLGLNDDEVDVTQGMGTYGRFKLSFQPTEQDKVKHLEDTYGRENIRAVDIGGKTKLLYRDEQETGGQFRAVDEEGVSLADFFGDVAGDVLPTAASVAGGVGGFAVGGIPGSVAGAALAGGAARGLQDVATRTLSDEDIQGGEIAKRATIEAGVGAVADVFTLGAGKFISKKIGSDLAKKATTGLVDSEKALAKYGVELEPAQRIGGAALDDARQIAKERPKSRVGKGFQRQQDALLRLKQASTGEIDTAGFGRVLDDVARQNEELTNLVTGFNKEAGEALKASLDREIAQYATPRRISGQEAGEELRKRFTDPAIEKIEGTNKAKFEELARVGADKEVKSKSIISAIEDAEKEFVRLKDPTSRKIARDLKQMMKGKEGEPLMFGDKPAVDAAGRPIVGKETAGKELVSFKEFREIIDDIGDSVSRSKDAGFSTRERVASKVLTNLQKLRGEIVQGDEALGAAFDDAIGYYKDKVLLTKRSGLGRATKERMADAAASPSQAIDTILQDPEFVDQLVRATDELGVGVSDDALDLLRDRMLSKMGFADGAEVRKGFTMSDKQKDVLQRLWGTEGKRKVRNLEVLQKRINQSKGIDLAKVRKEELDELLSQFSTNDVNRVAQSIDKRMKAEAKQRKLTDNIILKNIINKRWTEFDSPDVAKALIDAPAGQTKQAWKKVPAAEKKQLTQESVAQFFKKYESGAAQASGGESLWNSSALARDLAGQKGKSLRENMDTIFGKELAREIISANEILEAGAKRGGAGAAPDVRPRFTFSPGNIAAYFVGDLAGGIKHRFMGWAYGSDALVPMLKMMKKDVGEEQMKKNLEKLLPSLLSAKGVASLANEASKDPRFDETAQEIMTGLQDQ